MRSLHQWLAKHARHIHSLNAPGIDGTKMERIELAALSASCLTGCCAATPLQHLTALGLGADSCIPWLRGLSGTLECVALEIRGSDASLALAASLKGLTGLRALELDLIGVAAVPSHLPPALTALKLTAKNRGTPCPLRGQVRPAC